MAEDPLQHITRELLFTTFLDRASGMDEPWIIDRIVDRIEEQVVGAGEVLFRAGDPSEYVHLMSDGRVRLRAEGHPDWVYEGRWVIGTTDLIVGRPRARTAIVEVPTRLFRLRGEHWTELMEDSFEATSAALVGSARGTLALHEKVHPHGGFLHRGARPSEARARVELETLVDRAVLFYETPLLRGAGVQPLTDLARVSAVHDLARGEVLFAPGAPPGRTFVVAEGEIEARLVRQPDAADPLNTTRSHDIVARFGPGSVVGGAASLGDPQGRWGAEAVSSARVVSFSTEDWFDELEEHPELGRAAMQVLALEREHLFDLLAGGDAEIVLR